MKNKQYINGSNLAPSMGLTLPWLLSLTAYVLHWPTWFYGVFGTIAIFSVIVFFTRIFTENGVDVVNRGGE